MTYFCCESKSSCLVSELFLPSTMCRLLPPGLRMSRRTVLDRFGLKRTSRFQYFVLNARGTISLMWCWSDLKTITATRFSTLSKKLLSILPIVFLLPLSFFPTNHKVSSLWKTTGSTYLLICKSVSSSVSSFVFILVFCFVWGWGQKVRVHFKLCYTTEPPHLRGFRNATYIWAAKLKGPAFPNNVPSFSFYSTVTLPPSWGRWPQPLLLLLSTQTTSGTPAGSQHFLTPAGQNEV